MGEKPQPAVVIGAPGALKCFPLASLHLPGSLCNLLWFHSVAGHLVLWGLFPLCLFPVLAQTYVAAVVLLWHCGTVAQSHMWQPWCQRRCRHRCKNSGTETDKTETNLAFPPHSCKEPRFRPKKQSSANVKKHHDISKLFSLPNLIKAKQIRLAVPSMSFRLMFWPYNETCKNSRSIEKSVFC